MRVLVAAEAPSFRRRRTLAVGAIVFGLVMALLGAWFAAGWRDVRARQRETRGEPAATAAARADELARDLRGRLETLLAREAGRAYDEYRKSWVPAEPLVLGYFQIDAHGDVTTPAPTDLAEQRAFRDEGARVLVGPLRDGRVTARPEIVVSALAWKTLPFGGAPALVAVRRVDTQDGALAQGFVVDRAALTSVLAARAGEQVAELHADGAGVDVVAGWTLTVAPNPHAVARAYDAAAAIARDFVIWFVAVALAAMIAAAFVVMLVARERRAISPPIAVDAQVGPVGEALRELAERAGVELDRAGATLAVDVDPELRARFDRDALARVLGNLLDAAEKSARDTEHRTIDLAARDRGDRIEIEVTDRGTGTAHPLSRSLARAMGGDLEHRAGKFVLTLPRA